MIRGLYSAASGLLVQACRSDVIAANLANASVPGYRRDIPTVSTFGRALEYAGATLAAGPSGQAMALLPSTRVDLAPGSLRETGRDLDLALDGPGYFCVQTPAGEAYTRSGAFRLDTSHRLVTVSGHPVVGQAGAISVTGTDLKILENGDVFADGARVDRLKLVDLPAGALITKLGDGLLKPAPGNSTGATPSVLSRVRQRYLENANVNAVAELAAMISTLRAFEASQRALLANDQTLDKAINEIGRV